MLIHIVFSVAGVLAQGTTASMPTPTPVAAKGTIEPAGAVAILWDSEAAKADCVAANSAALVRRSEMNLARVRRGLSPLPPADSEEPEVCVAATVAKLTRGTEVSIEPEPQRCGAMKRIEVLSGMNQGKKGCVRSNDLDDAGPPTGGATENQPAATQP